MAAAKTSKSDEKPVTPTSETAPAEVGQADGAAVGGEALAQPDEEARVREADGSPIGGDAAVAVIPDKEDSPAKNEPSGDTVTAPIAEGPGPAAFPETPDEAGHQNPSQGQIVTYGTKGRKHAAIVTRTRRTALGQTDGEDTQAVLDDHETVDLTVFGFGKVSHVKAVPFSAGGGDDTWSWPARSEGAVGGA